MNYKFKALLGAVATLGLLAAGISMPAFASGSQGVSIVETNDTLAGSTISGYDPNTTLRLAVFVDRGMVSWNDQGSGASLVSAAGYTAPLVWLEGTESQLNGSLADISIQKPCGGNYTIYAEVSDSQFLVNPATGHLYKASSTVDEFDAAKAAAQATPLVPGGTNTFGYLATITGSLENTLLSGIANGSWIGGSDAALEGDWNWVDGPEAGTLFYRGQGNNGGTAQNGAYVNFNSGEPNNFGNGENSLQINNDGGWNDNSGPQYSITEWGGMPGDDLSSVSYTEDDISQTVAGTFGGSGTQADPYQISNDAELYAVATCAGQDVYFKQTANITLPNTWSGDQDFFGHYDGNGKIITYSPNTPTHNRFGVWSRGGTSSDAYIHDLTVTGDIDATGNNYVGLLIGQAYTVHYDHITVSGTITAGGDTYDTGGVDGGHYGGTLDHITSTVDFNINGNVSSLGGIAGTVDSEVDHSTWNGTMTGAPGARLSFVGGIMGEGDCGSVYHSSSAGSITGTDGGSIGGIGGNICGEISDTHSSVNVSVPAANAVGGLLGTGSCVGAYRDWATGNVSGNEQVGGLVGSNCGDVQDSYATGNVTGNRYVGSLAGGQWGGLVSRNYSLGAITDASASSRGWAGDYDNLTLEKTHWVPELSTITVPGAGNGETPFSVADATSLNFYTNENWSISNRWSADTVWKICPGVNNGYPILVSGYTTNQCASEMTNASAPTITGTGVVGKALGVTKGSWDAGVAFTYQWKLDGNNITGATAATYKPVAGDVGKTVTVELTGSKSGYLSEVKLSTNSVVVSAAPVVVAPTEIAIGEFAGNAWWIPLGFVAKVKAAVKAHASATALTCVGIVAPGGRQAWEKKLGLKRAALTCAIAKSFNSKLKTKLDWRISAPTDKVKRGAAVKFNK